MDKFTLVPFIKEQKSVLEEIARHGRILANNNERILIGQFRVEYLLTHKDEYAHKGFYIGNLMYNLRPRLSEILEQKQVDSFCILDGKVPIGFAAFSWNERRREGIVEFLFVVDSIKNHMPIASYAYEQFHLYNGNKHDLLDIL